MESLSELLVVGLSHRSAPIEIRERMAVASGALPSVVVELRAACRAREAVLLSTCNRVELYLVGASGDGDLQERAKAALASRAGTSPGELEPHLRCHAGVDAMAHMLRVASSLESMVVGEPQILGQVKEAFDVATSVGAAGALLGACFPEAFHVAKRVRNETEIARNPVSVSSVAVDLARQVFGGFDGKTVLLIGAGEMADLAARALAAKGASVLVTNRTEARARELAAVIGGAAHPFEDLAGALQRADIVIASTGAPHPILTRALLGSVQRARRSRSLLLVDIAVPRDVEPAAAEVEGVFVADIDDLEKVVAQHQESRRGAAEHAERIIAEGLEHFVRARSGRSVGPLITALRNHVLEMCRAEVERTVQMLPALGEKERSLIRQMGERIANKVLHEPQMALKRDAAQRGSTLAGAVEQLFNLPPENPLPGEAETAEEFTRSSGGAGDLTQR